MSFSNLKKRSEDNFDKLTSELNKINKGGDSYKDDRFWRPELDKAGNGYAVIRFLPPGEGEDLPWARLFSHAFKGPGGWYIENSRTTLGDKDPVSEMNTRLWNSGNEKDKDVARSRKRKLQYISNILVVSDPSNPENEGKVFLYKYGKKIFDKINEAMNPEFQDEQAINPFDFWKGANFRLKVRKVAGFINYDKSEFDTMSELFDGDDGKLEELWKTQYELKSFTDASNFKSYDELKTKMHRVLGGDGEVVTPTAESAVVNSDTPTVSDDVPSDESSDDAMSYFERLANES
mgnify:FL=1|tara:strand:- start:13622 stop:14494 length:873 start_codon:yes stop_codon:yes gene_type:complete